MNEDLDEMKEAGASILRRAAREGVAPEGVLDAMVAEQLKGAAKAGTADEHLPELERDFLRVARFGVRWGQAGFPQVTLGHKLAASLMATSLLPEYVDHVAFPWPCFVVIIPNGLLSLECAEAGRSLDLHHAMFVNDLADDQTADMLRMKRGGVPSGTRLAYFARSDNDVELMRMLNDVRDLVQRLDDDETGNARALTLVGRLLVGASIELDQRKSGAHTSGGKKKRKADEPSTWNFKLTRDVKVDCRSWVGEYVSGERRSLAVQSLIRGHHKSQPCGPGNVLRKWIHIEPYWRGPEDGPVAVRGHDVPDDRKR